MQKLSSNQSSKYCRVTIRVDLQLYEQLMAEVVQQGKRLSCVIREALKIGLSQQKVAAHQLKLEKTQIKTLAEMLYLLKTLTEKIDPAAKDKAEQHGLAILENLYKETL
jgi:hypothetical protein